MAYGLEVYSPTGEARLSVTDRLTYVHSVVYTEFWSGTPEERVRFYPVTGMADDGSWFIVTECRDVIGWVVSGGYYVRVIRNYGIGEFSVTIYRC